MRTCSSVIGYCMQYAGQPRLARQHGDALMGTLGPLRKRLHQLWITHSPEWSRHGKMGAVTAVDLLPLAIAYIDYVMHSLSVPPRPLERADAVGLQRMLRTCQMEWHISADLNRKWVARLPAMWRAFTCALVTCFSHGDTDPATATTRTGAPTPDGSLGTGTRYADLDVHAVFENRTRAMEQAKRDKSESKDGGGGSSDGGDTSSASTDGDDIMDRERFLVLGARTFSASMAELALLRGRELDETRDTERDACAVERAVKRMLHFVVTDVTSTRFARWHLLRCLPLGALAAATRFTHGEWDAVGAPAVLREELGDDALKRVQETTQYPLYEVFRLPPSSPDNEELKRFERPSWRGFSTEQVGGDHGIVWTHLRQSWLLAVWDRRYRTMFGHSFVEQYVLLHAQVQRYGEKVQKRTVWGRLRLPMLLDVCGVWIVERPVHADGTNVAAMTRCQGLLTALAVWCRVVLAPPYHGKDTEGRQLGPLLREMLDVPVQPAVAPRGGSSRVTGSASSRSATESTPVWSAGSMGSVADSGVNDMDVDV